MQSRSYHVFPACLEHNAHILLAAHWGTRLSKIVLLKDNTLYIHLQENKYLFARNPSLSLNASLICKTLPQAMTKSELWRKIRTMLCDLTKPQRKLV
jgi:hypothetical protein